MRTIRFKKNRVRGVAAVATIINNVTSYGHETLTIWGEEVAIDDNVAFVQVQT